MPAETIASLFVRDPERVLRQARRAAMQGADWIELRLDEWSGPRGDLRTLLEKAPLPVLVTCRTPKDGGLYRGESRARIELLEAALEDGAQGIDVEDWEPWSPDPSGLRLVVRSMHDLHGVPSNLPDIRDRLLETGAHVAKIVGMANDLADAGPIMRLMAETDVRTTPTCAFAMGRETWPTRIIAAALGAPYCYARVAGDEETAPGQPAVNELVSLYGLRTIGPATRILGLLGNPARHSWGPWLHNRAFRAMGVDAVYLPFETSRPLEWVEALPQDRLVGLSVTAPHKEIVRGRCDRMTETAEIAGAVNTMVYQRDGVLGENTDIAGVEGALRNAGLQGPSAAGRRGVVLGGGGGARAAALALSAMGFDVAVLARSLDPMREFCREHGFDLQVMRTEVLESHDPEVVVHATPVGGQRKAGDESSEAVDRILPDWQPKAGIFVLDMVYAPDRDRSDGRTALLDAAFVAGAVPVSGAEMFVAQAAAQLRAFFDGVDVPDESVLRGFVGLEC